MCAIIGSIAHFNAYEHFSTHKPRSYVKESCVAVRILTVLREKGPLGFSALLRELGEPISQRALQNELRCLRRAGLITAMGKGRATTYRVEDKPVG